MVLHFSDVLLENVCKATQKSNIKKHQQYTRDEVDNGVEQRINTMKYVQVVWGEQISIDTGPTAVPPSEFSSVAPPELSG